MAGGMDFWREHVKAIERDGWLSSEYARAHDLSVTSLYYWRAKFRSMTAAAGTHSKFIISMSRRRRVQCHRAC